MNNGQLTAIPAAAAELREDRAGTRSAACAAPVSRPNRDAGILVGGRAEDRDAALAARPTWWYLGELEVLLPLPLESQACCALKTGPGDLRRHHTDAELAWGWSEEPDASERARDRALRRRAAEKQQPDLGN